MTDGEGSVMTDGIDGEESSEESSESSENINNQAEESSETKKEASEEEESSQDSTSEKKDDSDEEDSDKKEEETKADDTKDKTEKGTKLDSDPLSRAHQLRANAEAEARSYQGLLNDPERLESYLKELKAEKGEADKDAEPDDFKKLDPGKLETVEDLQKFAAGLKDATVKEIARVKRELGGLSANQQEESLSRSISGSISEVQTKYPELREFNSDGSKNPEYNEELDTLVGSMYNELDLDKSSKKYRGNVSLLAIADKIMSARRVGEGNGSRKAQTDIIDKRKGRIAGTGADMGGTRPDDSKLSPSAAIAERMKRATSKR